MRPIRPIAAFRGLCIPGFVFISGLLAGLNAGAAGRPCDPDGAIALHLADLGEDGVLFTSDHLRLRLAGIVWPDPVQVGSRERLAATLRQALAGQALSWKPAAGPDRWGEIPANLFVREPGAAAPFWLQAGLVEKGLVPAWPEPSAGACFDELGAHEQRALMERRGYWAPRAQTQRHLLIERNREAHAGRRLVAVFRIASVRPWRSLHFLNLVSEERPGPAISLPNAVVTRLTERGASPRQWRGARVLARFVLGPEGLRRLRAESIDHIRKLD